MGNVFHIWWTVVWVWVVVTVCWWIAQFFISPILEAAAPFATTGLALTAFQFTTYAWYYFPVIFMLGMVIWALWASQKPDPESVERYYG